MQNTTNTAKQVIGQIFSKCKLYNTGQETHNNGSKTNKEITHERVQGSHSITESQKQAGAREDLPTRGNLCGASPHQQETRLQGYQALPQPLQHSEWGRGEEATRWALQRKSHRQIVAQQPVIVEGLERGFLPKWATNLISDSNLTIPVHSSLHQLRSLSVGS